MGAGKGGGLRDRKALIRACCGDPALMLSRCSKQALFLLSHVPGFPRESLSENLGLQLLQGSWYLIQPLQASPTGDTPPANF